jgi:hypothetical protein
MTSKCQVVLREVLLWYHLTQLRHENILPLIGITSSQFPDLKMVSPLQENGNLREYIKKPENVNINRLKIVRMLLVCSTVWRI